MDRLVTCKNSNSCRNLPGPGGRLEEHDANDTVDCFTLPEIDIPHEQLCCFTQLPGFVPRLRGAISERNSTLDTREANTCNILSPDVSKAPINPTDSEGKDRLATNKNSSTQKSTVFVPSSSTKCGETVKIKGTMTNVNFSPKKFSSPSPQRVDIDFELSDQVFASAKDNLDSSNASKPLPSRSDVRSHSSSPYSKHITDPPKWRPFCYQPNLTSHAASSVDVPTEEPTLPKSVVYITRQPGCVYQLEFYTKNTIVSPLYIDERFGMPPANEKKVQPSYFEYRDQSPRHELSVTFVRRKLAVNTTGSKPKPYKYVLPPLRVYTDDVLSPRKRTHSETNKETSSGNVYFLYNGILLRIRCTPMSISQIKSPVSGDILACMAKLNMPSSESRKNKGVIIGRCGFDLLQFTFDMDQISLNRFEQKGTVAVQTEDRMVYIRERSKITGRFLLLALPESTYFYRDPMVNIHRLHANFHRTNVMPLWKYELMKTRLAERSGALEIEAKIDRVFKQTRGSRLFFEGLDSLITVQGGLMGCEVPFGQDKYEAMMQNEYNERHCYRRKALQYTSKKWKSTAEVKEHSIGDAPDTAVSTQMEKIQSTVSDEKC